MENTKEDRYRNFLRIDGRHPYREYVADGFVDYRARTRRGGRVFYFNFALAKEMGLIDKKHPHKMTQDLSQAILKVFGIQIINEYDLMKGTAIDWRDIRRHEYMATRYLQMQHPGKLGQTSGDGRSIWNGVFRSRSGVWDITSNGTGATKLSPATAIEKKYFKTGSKEISYGCGRADLSDGISAALMSDIFYRNHIDTERTLAVIAYADKTSINVRAGKNLLRPAHFFRLLKQNSLEGLQGIFDYFIERQQQNGVWPKYLRKKDRYDYFLKYIAEKFATAAALFEMEYIFCWMDWDGDNILMDASIIDYGSVRQFGLYHREYRYDDVQMMSTSIPEQKNKARYIVQSFIQLVDFLKFHKKRPRNKFRQHTILKYFDKIFEEQKAEMLLNKIGFQSNQIKKIMKDRRGMRSLRDLQQSYHFFERTLSKKNTYKVSDGVTRDAVFCMRDVLRELPEIYAHGCYPVPPKDFMKLLKSSYASARDLRISKSRVIHMKRFQLYYKRLILRASELLHVSEKRIVDVLIQRSRIINRYERVTGDSVLVVTDRLIRSERKLGSLKFHQLFDEFVAAQVLCPQCIQKGYFSNHIFRESQIFYIYKRMFELVKEKREGI